jgi:hypothetical protein
VLRASVGLIMESLAYSTMHSGPEFARLDPLVTEVILSGNGESFCSGGDLAEFGSFADPATAHVSARGTAQHWYLTRSPRDTCKPRIRRSSPRLVTMKRLVRRKAVSRRSRSVWFAGSPLSW